MPAWMILTWGLVSVVAAPAAEDESASRPGELRPVVEVEEDVYRYEPADNGSGPLWCSGSTCLVRIGDHVFASGTETLPGVAPLNNCRATLHQRGESGWQRCWADPAGRTREPSPLVTLPEGGLFLSVNPTLVTDPEVRAGPARPAILRFSPSAPQTPAETILPVWEGEPAFCEHSYRSFAADGSAGTLVLFQNIGYTHAEWAFRDGAGQWTARGKLVWPQGTEYEKPQPIRVCYPNVAVRGRAVHFCGVSDIVEPNSRWREAKRRLTGRDWDYDFRRLFYTWTDDVASGGFHPWVEIASREATAGWITPGDLWVAPDGTVHLVWTERAIDERLRAEFFPDASQAHTLFYARVRDGHVLSRTVLLQAKEGGPAEVPGRCRLHATPDGRLLALYFVSGRDAAGKGVQENRLVELLPDGTSGPPMRVSFARPFPDFFTATVRGGSLPSEFLDILGPRAGAELTLSYARLRIGK